MPAFAAEPFLRSAVPINRNASGISVEETDNPVFASIAKHGVILRFSVPSPKLLSGLWFSGVLPGLKRFHTHQSDSGAAGPACCRYASYIGPTSLSTSLTFYSNQRSRLGSCAVPFVHLHYMPRVSKKSIDGMPESAQVVLYITTKNEKQISKLL